MTSVPATLAESETALLRRRLRLHATVGTHAIVDLFSTIVIPLLTVLEGRLTLSHAQGAFIVAIGSICSGAIQPLVAWLSDRHDTRWHGTAGLVLLVAAISMIGWAHDFGDLVLLQVLSAAGSGAFHPVAAAAVGHLANGRRSAWMSVFFAGGMIGGVSGAFIAPFYAKRFGLQAFAWMSILGAAAAVVLIWAIHSIPHRSRDAHARHESLSPRQRRDRWIAVGVLYVGNVIRFTVNTALVYLLVRWSEALVLAREGAATLTPELRTLASTLNGPMQASMQAGMGVGGLAAGFLLRAHHEKLALVAIPSCGAIFIAGFPFVPHWSSWGFSFLAGIAFASTVPITISLAQRLLPHRTSLASGLMMGGAWMFGGAGPWIADALRDRVGLDGAFVAIAGMLIATGAVSLGIKPTRD